jgi:hypothetical protein
MDTANKILDELTGIDPELQKDRHETIKAISRFKSLQPHAPAGQNFKSTLLDTLISGTGDTSTTRSGFTNRISYFWAGFALAALIAVLIVTGIQRQKPVTSRISNIQSPANRVPANEPSNAIDHIVVPQPETYKIPGWKTYTNTEFGFSFQYPQEWDNVKLNIEKNNPKVDHEGACAAQGYAVFGNFSNANTIKLQFGAVSSDYKICLGRGGGLADFVKFKILKNNIRMYTWSDDRSAYDYKLEKIVSTATLGKNGYIFKDTSWADEATAMPAAIVESPSPKIGALSLVAFNSGSYADTMDLLDKILSSFMFIE